MAKITDININILIKPPKAITIFQCLTGNNVCFVAIAVCVVGTHSHFIVTKRVQVC